MSEFTFELAMELYKSTELFPIDLDDAWIWLGYQAKRDCRDVLFNNFVEGIDFLGKGTKSSTGGRPSEWIMLTVECFKSLGMMAGTEKGKEIRHYFLDCERLLKQGFSLLIGDISDMVTDAVNNALAPEREENRKYRLACREHKGTGSVIQADVDAKQHPIETISSHEYCRRKGIDPSIWLTFSRRYGQFVRVGTGSEPPSYKGKLLVCGDLYYYADAALKSILDLD